MPGSRLSAGTSTGSGDPRTTIPGPAEPLRGSEGRSSTSARRVPTTSRKRWLPKKLGLEARRHHRVQRPAVGGRVPGSSRHASRGSGPPRSCSTDTSQPVRRPRLQRPGRADDRQQGRPASSRASTSTATSASRGEMQRQGLEAAIALPERLRSTTLSRRTPRSSTGRYMVTDVRAVGDEAEARGPEALREVDQADRRRGGPRTRSVGWVNADLFVTGLKSGGSRVHPTEGRRRHQPEQGLQGRRHPRGRRLDDRGSSGVRLLHALSRSSTASSSRRSASPASGSSASRATSRQCQ